MYGSTNLTIGAAGAGNVWDGSGAYPYTIYGYGSNWTIKGNRFGTSADGNTPFVSPNGIFIDPANNITVGGTGAGEGNQFGEFAGIVGRKRCHGAGQHLRPERERDGRL